MLPEITGIIKSPIGRNRRLLSLKFPARSSAMHRFAFALFLCAVSLGAAEPNHLTEAEKKAGCQLLFDVQSTDHCR